MAEARLTRSERKAQTRAGLVEAAARIFATRGYERATLAEVAHEAGYSTGAVYSNFGGKEDLLLAVYEEIVASRAREIVGASAEGGSAPARARHAGDQWMERLAGDPERFMLLIELWLRSVRDPAMRPEFVRRFAAPRDVIARVVERLAADHDLALPLPPERLAIALRALGNGMALEKVADPDGVPDELYGELLAVLFASFERAPARPEAVRPERGAGRAARVAGGGAA